jgi:hypothetical protein
LTSRKSRTKKTSESKIIILFFKAFTFNK